MSNLITFTVPKLDKIEKKKSCKLKVSRLLNLYKKIFFSISYKHIEAVFFISGYDIFIHFTFYYTFFSQKLFSL